MSFNAKFDTVLAAVRLEGYSIIVATICGLPGRYRALVTGPDDEVVADIQWPSSPFVAAREGRFAALHALGHDTYHVNLWGSKPGTNDDCDTGETFETEAEARRCYEQAEKRFSPSALRYAAWFELGVDYAERDAHGHQLVDTIAERRNPSYDRAAVERENAAYDAMCRNERAMQAGMAFGCQGFNDEMGW